VGVRAVPPRHDVQRRSQVPQRPLQLLEVLDEQRQ
jgi:hypothetical protein